MAVSASAKSRAAAISALIKRDAGFHVRPTGDKRDTGVTVRSGDRLLNDDWPRILITDPNDVIHDQAEISRVIEYRRYNISAALDKRGYTYETTWIDGDTICTIQVTGRNTAKAAKAPRQSKTHTVVLQFQINADAARQYLGSCAQDVDENQLARMVGAAISEMIEVSNAANLGAIVVTKNTFKN
jgi:hypothetical protein